MNVDLDHESRVFILDALRLYKKQGVRPNNPVIDNIFTELQPTGLALNASMGDVVLWNGDRYEVVHRHSGVDNPNDYVTIAPCSIDYENENPDPSEWPWVRARELGWPGLAA